ncbi:IPExxxVDY family protein [Flavobacterium soli]|uniref:IPExxxVDY family protein n=1 Tax=Flavobacterium soli TaxID=344881 RepID=UPI0003F97706|nr:IPExxxVDY family protein [Flavobacterium soli]
MVHHKLYIDEFDEIDYELIAIHTSLEDYRLAYFINQKLPILLSKSKEEIQITTKRGDANFSKYRYESLKEEVCWSLIQNKNEITALDKNKDTNLFSNSDLEIVTQVYFLPEFKKVDYFLKVENAEQTVELIINKINTIDRVSTVYKVEAEAIKSKNNLIF